VTETYSYLGNAHTEAIENLYQQYKNDPESVDYGWRKFFEGFDFQQSNFDEGNVIPENTLREFKVLNLINAYRSRGHLFTKTNPVRKRRQYSPTLAIENFGLSEADLNIVFQAGEEIGIGPATLSAIIEHLELTYCQSIGIEYTYIREPHRVAWIRNRIELKNRPTFSKELKLEILKKLNQASVFEQYIQKKFVGQKRFSIEGGESLISALHALVERGVDQGVKQFVIGMAHRGRLNALAHILDKPYEHIFSEFAGNQFDSDGLFDGDVKYHLGYSKTIKTHKGKDAHITLCPNPSHLEAVNPIVTGLSRAKIDNSIHDEEKIVPILVHGDAAIAGQGIIYEVVQMAQLDGYRAGGTIHMVVNNQVGFTTNYLDGRSSTYCTDVAKATLCPVFHVNSDDVEAVIQTIQIALDYRQEFKRDVFIDLLGYRKYGHNEGDEPKFTQPKLYNIIASHPNPKAIYLEKLISEGVVDKAYGEKLENDLLEKLDQKFEDAKSIEHSKIKNFLAETWEDFSPSTPADFLVSPDTSYSETKLLDLAKNLFALPEGKKFFRKTEKLMADRKKMIKDDRLDWGMAEALAYASLLEEGRNIRLSGQDVERGTFSHRHAVIKTEDTEEEIIPLNSVAKKQGEFRIFNSPLSEYGVLGFDYGYAFGTPKDLTIWEAQFGDFFNGAQIMIDQFISAAEDKWRIMNGIVMYLPHGYEGMGSEHSSARLERFLQLCAEYNMQVCNCTTPANFFHLIRRQLHRSFRKPLIVFTPKKLLRYPKAVSSIKELAKGRFAEVIDDESADPKKVKTVVFCSGKLYYDILEVKEEMKDKNDLALVRIEQLYPLPENQLDEIVQKYGKNTSYVWAQEEPENMGAWSYMFRSYRKVNLDLIAKNASASPAPGSPQLFEIRQKAVIDAVLNYKKK
jgi:2-oxoglutarate dehydrogenase E1 component